jgi:hypothetical protein
MSGRKVADRPDPEWVVTLKEGDRVAVAERGRVAYEGGIVRRITPTGILKVYPDATTSLYFADSFWGRHVRPYHVGWQRGGGFGSRYLVPVAAQEGA